MAFQATVLQVMIASPGDVTEERILIRDTLHDWNDVNAASGKVMLQPVGWDSHSSPELGARPQELINNRILKECDLLIGVFWTRIGSPTGCAVSGTVEEIQQHVASGKPAMLYFSSRPAAPDSIDINQYAELKKFKNWSKLNGLIEEFDSCTELRQKLQKQLPLCIRHNDHIKQIINTTLVTTRVNQLTEVEQTHNLTSDAVKLLKAAANGAGKGIIILRRELKGQRLTTGEQDFGGCDARDSARWESALRELVKNGLVVSRDNRGIIFEITHTGWTASDEI